MNGEKDLTQIRNTGWDVSFCLQKMNVSMMKEIIGFYLSTITARLVNYLRLVRLGSEDAVIFTAAAKWP